MMASTYQDLNEFLAKHSTKNTNSTVFTHTRIPDKELNIFPGSYLIPKEDANIFYKLGITNRNIKSRISSMKIDKKYKYSILQELHFDIGADASKLELNLKHINNKYQYKGEPIMKNGNTEVFIIDILGLDM